MSEEEKLIEKLSNYLKDSLGKDLIKALKTTLDKLQKENKKYIDILNATEKIMNGQERTKDKLLKENVELQKDNYKLDRENQHFFDRIQDLQKENEELQKEIESKNKQIKLMQEMNLPEEIEINYISKDKIKAKIKELEERLQFEYVLYEKAEERSDAQYATHRRINMINFVLEVLNELLGE